jgi:G3E family GTPase
VGESSGALVDRGESLGEEDQRPLVQLLVDQIEFADVIVLNKASMLAPTDLQIVRQLLRSLNTDAEIVETDFSEVALDSVLGTGRFDFEKAQQHPHWAKELYGFATHIPESEEYGIESFVYRARRPFDPERFHAFLNSSWPNVVRAKGFFWLATRPDWMAEVSQAGALVRNERMGRWWAAVPEDQRPGTPDLLDYLERVWDARFGDRRQEIVMIGIGMDKALQTARLDACLTEPGSMGTSGKILPRTDLEDPFPKWV